MKSLPPAQFGKSSLPRYRPAEVKLLTKVVCTDNSLEEKALTIGQVYEVAGIEERYDNYYIVGIEGKTFSRRRFKPVE